MRDSEKDKGRQGEGFKVLTFSQHFHMFLTCAQPSEGLKHSRFPQPCDSCEGCSGLSVAVERGTSSV